MLLRRLSLCLFILLVLGQIAWALWRFLPIEPSTASVFHYPTAASRFGDPGDLKVAIEMYQADRGAELALTAPDGLELTVFYFEWDRIGAGPMMTTAGHTPDQCNVAAGFTLVSVDPPRTYQAPGQLPMVFDATTFKDKAGRDMYTFKLAWMQGLGSRSIREGKGGLYRIERLRNSFIRHVGELRVLQAGVFNARNSDQAWQAFQSQVLDQLEWKTEENQQTES